MESGEGGARKTGAAAAQNILPHCTGNHVVYVKEQIQNQDIRGSLVLKT